MPCAPKRMIFTLPPTRTATTAFLVRCLGVLFGLFSPLSPALFSLAFSLSVSAMSYHIYDFSKSSCFHHFMKVFMNNVYLLRNIRRAPDLLNLAALGFVVLPNLGPIAFGAAP